MFPKFRLIFILLFLFFAIFSVNQKYAFSEIGTNTVLELSWTANGDADYHEAYYRSYGTNEEWVKAGSTTGNSMNIVVPEINRDYEFSVRGFNIYGNSSDFSDPVRLNPSNLVAKKEPLKKVTGINILIKIFEEIITPAAPTASEGSISGSGSK